VQRKLAHAAIGRVEPRLRSPGERPAARGSGERQREPVRYNLLAIEDDMRVHRDTSCCLSRA